MFLDKLKVIEEVELELDLPIENNEYGARHLKWLEIGSGLYLSVQASCLHYCRPRKLIKLEDYTHFELALVKEDELISDISIINDFPRFSELEMYWDYGIFAYVPKDLINDLYYWCLENFKED